MCVLAKFLALMKTSGSMVTTLHCHLLPNMTHNLVLFPQDKILVSRQELSRQSPQLLKTNTIPLTSINYTQQAPQSSISPIVIKSDYKVQEPAVDLYENKSKHNYIINTWDKSGNSVLMKGKILLDNLSQHINNNRFDVLSDQQPEADQAGPSEVQQEINQVQDIPVPASCEQPSQQINNPSSSIIKTRLPMDIKPDEPSKMRDEGI